MQPGTLWPWEALSVCQNMPYAERLRRYAYDSWNGSNVFERCLNDHIHLPTAYVLAALFSVVVVACIAYARGDLKLQRD